jgi:mannose-1-phosphate guanylyltransferase
MSTDNDVVVVILGGGQGTRFWPLSRTEKPKQFLSLGDGEESLIQATVRRVAPLASAGNIKVVANEGLAGLIQEHVPEAELIVEPEARNTAACIGLSAVTSMVSSGSDPVLVVLPADHAVGDEETLRKNLCEAIKIAREKDVLVTIGIAPTSPHTGYGYIKRGTCVSGRVHTVERFFEKPSLQRAQKYLEAGGFSWNSGMFAWRASVLLEAFRSHMPEMYSGLCDIKSLMQERGIKDATSSVGDIFSRFESISIDFGVLEHARNCVVLDAEPFGWNDVGSWDQWAEKFDVDGNSNLLQGDVLALDCSGCVVRANDRHIAAVGLKDVVIVDSGDALLVVSRDHVQDVRRVVAELKARGRKDLI